MMNKRVMNKALKEHIASQAWQERPGVDKFRFISDETMHPDGLAYRIDIFYMSVLVATAGRDRGEVNYPGAMQWKIEPDINYFPCSCGSELDELRTFAVTAREHIPAVCNAAHKFLFCWFGEQKPVRNPDAD